MCVCVGGGGGGPERPRKPPVKQPEKIAQKKISALVYLLYNITAQRNFQNLCLHRWRSSYLTLLDTFLSRTLLRHTRHLTSVCFSFFFQMSVNTHTHTHLHKHTHTNTHTQSRTLLIHTRHLTSVLCVCVCLYLTSVVCVCVSARAHKHTHAHAHTHHRLNWPLNAKR